MAAVDGLRIDAVSSIIPVGAMDAMGPIARNLPPDRGDRHTTIAPKSVVF